MLKRLFPHPCLSLTLFVVWLLLVNQFKVGSLVMAVILGTVIPLLTAAWWPDRARIRHPLGAGRLRLLVLWDVIVANFQVARIVLFMPRDKIQSAWIAVPVDLHLARGDHLLAGTITMTPGTLTAECRPAGGATDPRAARARPGCRARRHQVPLRGPAEKDIRMILRDALDFALGCFALALVLNLCAFSRAPTVTDRISRSIRWR